METSPTVDPPVYDGKPAQPGRNGGWLRAGGRIGNAGGTGRTPEAIRVRSGQTYDALLDEVERRIATGLEKMTPSELAQLLNTTGRYAPFVQEVSVRVPDTLSAEERAQRLTAVTAQLAQRIAGGPVAIVPVLPSQGSGQEPEPVRLDPDAITGTSDSSSDSNATPSAHVL